MNKSWYYNGGMSTINSFRVRDISDIPLQYLMFLDSLEYHVETEGFIIVHAGLNFEIDDPFSDKHAMLWARNGNVVPELINHRKVVHGHTPMVLDKIKEQLDHDTTAYDLDNGCVYSGVEGLGNLCALELNSLKLEVQPNVDLF